MKLSFILLFTAVSVAAAAPTVDSTGDNSKLRNLLKELLEAGNKAKTQQKEKIQPVARNSDAQQRLYQLAKLLASKPDKAAKNSPPGPVGPVGPTDTPECHHMKMVMAQFLTALRKSVDLSWDELVQEILQLSGGRFDLNDEETMGEILCHIGGVDLDNQHCEELAGMASDFLSDAFPSDPANAYFKMKQYSLIISGIDFFNKLEMKRVVCKVVGVKTIGELVDSLEELNITFNVMRFIYDNTVMYLDMYASRTKPESIDPAQTSSVHLAYRLSHLVEVLWQLGLSTMDPEGVNRLMGLESVGDAPDIVFKPNFGYIDDDGKRATLLQYAVKALLASLPEINGISRDEMTQYVYNSTQGKIDIRDEADLDKILADVAKCRSLDDLFDVVKDLELPELGVEMAYVEALNNLDKLKELYQTMPSDGPLVKDFFRFYNTLENTGFLELHVPLSPATSA